MKRLISAGLFTLVSMLPAFSAPAEDTNDNPLANAPTQYSADLVITRKAGAPMTMRIYADGNKRRTERDGAGGNITIVRGDLNKRYILVPATKTYMEAPLDPRLLESPADWAKRMGIVHEKVGTEDVNGEPCDKYSYNSDPTKMANGQNKPMVPGRTLMTGFIWIGQTTHMLVKSESAGSTAEWKNIKVGPPDASVFELPVDYKKQEAGAGRPGQMRPMVPKLGVPKSGGESPSPTPSTSPEAEQKSEEQKPGELKSGDESPSPTPSASPSAEQKSDGEKSGGDK
jgi:hypothetical protein